MRQDGEGMTRAFLVESKDPQRHEGLTIQEACEEAQRQSGGTAEYEVSEGGMGKESRHGSCGQCGDPCVSASSRAFYVTGVL